MKKIRAAGAVNPGGDFDLYAKAVHSLSARSATALAVVTRTISDLKSINEDIDREQLCIQDAISKLRERMAELHRLSEQNTNIINNFTRLIEGDTEN